MNELKKIDETSRLRETFSAEYKNEVKVKNDFHLDMRGLIRWMA